MKCQRGTREIVASPVDMLAFRPNLYDDCFVIRSWSSYLASTLVFDWDMGRSTLCGCLSRCVRKEARARRGSRWFHDAKLLKLARQLEAHKHKRALSKGLIQAKETIGSMHIWKSSMKERCLNSRDNWEHLCSWKLIVDYWCLHGNNNKTTTGRDEGVGVENELRHYQASLFSAEATFSCFLRI